MFRQSLVKVSRNSLSGRRTFVASATAWKLPSVEQPHTLEKPGKDDTNPQTESMKKSMEEKEATSQKPKQDKPKKGPNAGIGLQVISLSLLF
jgi:hypothetical protein